MLQGLFNIFGISLGINKDIFWVMSKVVLKGVL